MPEARAECSTMPRLPPCRNGVTNPWSPAPARSRSARGFASDLHSLIEAQPPLARKSQRLRRGGRSPWSAGRGRDGQRGGWAFLGQRADLCADPQIIRGSEGMFANHAVPVDEHEARRTAHVVALHGLRYRSRDVRLVETDRKL